MEHNLKITKDEVLRTAELARLEITDDELERFSEQLGHILEYIEGLNELDTTDIEPTSHVLDLSTHLREDVVKQIITTDQALRNAPQSEDNFFVVPKVIED